MAPVQDHTFRQQLADGDLRAAAEWLVRHYADEVMGLCTAMVRHRDTAEDLAQDVYGRAFAGLDEFRGEASARTWLLKIARNRCIDHLRAQKREPWGGPAPDPSWDPEEPADESPLPAELVLQRDDVDDALAELAEADRALIVLRFRNGLEYGELAMAFGLKEGAVRMRVSRALARMRKALESKHAVDELSVAPALGGTADEAMVSQAATPPAELAELSGAVSEMAEKNAEVQEVALRDADDRTEDLDLLADAEMAEPAGAPPSAAPAAPRAARAKRRSTGEVTPAQKKQASRGVFGRIADALRASEPPPAPPQPPVEHPLTAFFARHRDALSDELRGRLLDQARAL